jgi:hypothetical protein
VVYFGGFFAKLGYFAGFSLYIINNAVAVRISEAAMGGAGAGDLIFHSLCGKKKALDVGGPSSIDCKYFWGSNKKQQSCDGRGGGAQRPVWGGSELKKTGARSAWARTRGQNPLVYIYITTLPFVCRDLLRSLHARKKSSNSISFQFNRKGNTLKRVQKNSPVQTFFSNR